MARARERKRGVRGAVGRWARIACWLGAVFVLAIAVGLSACGGVIAPGDGSDSGVDAARDASGEGADVVRDARDEAADRVTRDSGKDGASPDAGTDAAGDTRDDTTTIDSGSDVKDGARDVSSVDGGDAPGKTVEELVVTPAVATAEPASCLGGAAQFTATAIYSDGTTANVTTMSSWSSSSTFIATIGSSTGLAIGDAPGAATITAKFDGLAGTASLVIVAAVCVTSVNVSPPSRTTTPGDLCGPVQFTATATYSDGTTADVTTMSTWTSGTLAVATIGATTGLAEGVAAGTTTITATFDGKSGTAALTVATPTLTSISVTPATASVAAGGTQPFTANAHLSDGSTCDVTTKTSWLSSAPGVATVSSAGLATGVTAGTTTITASLGGITSNAATLTVTHVLTSVTVTPNPSRGVNIGCPEQFTATATYSDGTTADVTALSAWSSSVASEVSISAGLVIGLSAGFTLITATLDGMTSAPVAFTVDAASLVSIAVTPTSASVAAGGTQPFSATGYYTDGTTCNITVTTSWQSSATSVATVSSGGLATAVATGSATITATQGAISGDATLTVP